MADFQQLDFTFQAAQQRRVWTVHDLVQSVRTHLEREYTDVFVEGEISNYRPAESGHLYFTLKDDGSQMRIVMFRTQARLLRFKPANGMQVIARGRITIYEGRGELQLMAEYLEPKGAGAVQVAFEQLKAKLAAEGLFDNSRKKPLPAMPGRIGIVTSPRGAAIQDMLNILRRRHEGVNIVIYPAQVQGESAAVEVSAGVRFFNRAKNVDVIVVARGGGSLEDLAAFNDEVLARVISGSQLPVISAVGHETDFTIADFVADLRAPTPSAAAELVVQSRNELDDRLGNLRKRLDRAVRYQVLRARQALTTLSRHGAFARMQELIGRRGQRVDELVYRLARAHAEWLRAIHRRLDVAEARVRHHDLRTKFAAMKREIGAREFALESVIRRRVYEQRARVERAESQLQALSPVAILERGYALAFDERGELVKDAGQVAVGEKLRVRVARGEIATRVESKSPSTAKDTNEGEG